MNEKDDQSRPQSGIPLEQVPAPVPVFNLVVLVRPAGSRYSARIANLGIDPVEAATPRDAISRICTAAKTHLRMQHEAGEAIEWITPAASKLDDENQFMVPVHL